ncbi:DUF5412 family protein [Pradoshia sp.]
MGTNTVRAYLVNGGATSSYAIRGGLITHKKDDQTATIELKALRMNG